MTAKYLDLLEECFFLANSIKGNRYNYECGTISMDQGSGLLYFPLVRQTVGYLKKNYLKM